MDFLKDLNPEQKEAVTTMDKPVLVLAGAGSGKTRVITYRIAYSIFEQFNHPGEILAVTFTNKAAGEMRNRVSQLLKQDVSRLWISTFHSASVRILRQDIDKLGYKKDFTIYDDSDQSGVIREALRALGHEPKDNNIRGILSRISSAKSSMMPPAELRRIAMGPMQTRVADVYALYEAMLKRNNAVDFDDLLILTVKLLEEHKEVRDHYRDRFKHILVDEYQDTNHVQYRMMQMLGMNKQMVCAVGDDDQSIYAWRGADIQNILNFEKDYPGVKVVKLEQNYRSTQPILDAANRLIKRNSQRNEKKLWTAQKEGKPVQFLVLPNEMEEAKWVAQQIYYWRNYANRSYGDVAVFYRTHAQSRAFEDIFRGMRIPYRVVGGIKFYDRKEVKDLLAYLRAIVNPQDEVSLKRIINIPTRGIGDKTIEKIQAYAAASGISFPAALKESKLLDSISPKTRAKLIEFDNLMDQMRHDSQGISIKDFLMLLIEKLNYFNYLAQTSPVDEEQRVRNVEELVSAAADFEGTSEDNTPAAYLNQVALLTDVDMANEANGIVSLMTLHAAKGLEFPLVFLCGMEENIFPSLKESDEDYLTELEEERRLCYVGITRAREQLYMTAAEGRRMYGQMMYNMPSLFIEEIRPQMMKAGLSRNRGHYDDRNSGARRKSIYG